MRLRSIAAGAAGVGCLILTACVAGRPMHYYAINRPELAVAPPKPDGPVLLIGHVTTPEALQDERIRYRTGANEVGAYQYQRWAERPAVTVQTLLLQALRDGGKFREVQKSSSNAAGDYLLRGRLNEFAEIDNPGIQTRVALSLELVDRKTGSTIWAHDYSRDEPVKGKAMADVVASFEHSLQQVIGEAAAAIAANASH